MAALNNGPHTPTFSASEEKALAPATRSNAQVHFLPANLLRSRVQSSVIFNIPQGLYLLLLYNTPPRRHGEVKPFYS